MTANPFAALLDGLPRYKLLDGQSFLLEANVLAALAAKVPAVTPQVKDFTVEVAKGAGGSLALYFNDYRVAGGKPWGGGTTLYEFRVKAEDLKSSGILATVRNFQKVPVVKECLTAGPASAAAVPADLAEAGKVVDDCLLAKKVMADAGTFPTGQGIMQDCADTIRSLIALATAQAARIEGLTKERDELEAERRRAVNEAETLRHYRDSHIMAETALADMTKERDELKGFVHSLIANHETALAAERARTAKLVEALDDDAAKEVDRLRLKAFATNSQEDRMAYYKACSGWFQNRHRAAITEAGHE